MDRLGTDDFSNLVLLRDAEVMGIVFGVDGYPPSITCPCDAAGDGVSNGGTEGKTSTSADDDGGYLAERLQAYAATGGLPVWATPAPVAIVARWRPVTIAWGRYFPYSSCH